MRSKPILFIGSVLLILTVSLVAQEPQKVTSGSAPFETQAQAQEQPAADQETPEESEPKPASTLRLATDEGVFVVHCHFSEMEYNITGPGFTVVVKAPGGTIAIRPERGKLNVDSNGMEIQVSDLHVNKDGKPWLESYFIQGGLLPTSAREVSAVEESSN